MNNIDYKIEQFILNNINDFLKLEPICNGIYYKFINEKLGITLIPNIEELMHVITSNFKSDKIIVYTQNLDFEIYSYNIIVKLKEKIKDIINKEIQNKNNRMKNKNIKDKELFLEKFKQKG